MPPRKDFKPQTDALNNSPHPSSDVVSTDVDTAITTTKTPETITMTKASCSIVKDHPLKKRQSKSFDENNQQEKNKLKNDKKVFILILNIDCEQMYCTNPHSSHTIGVARYVWKTPN